MLDTQTYEQKLEQELLSGTFMIDKCDGTKLLSNAYKTFKYVDGNLKYWKITKQSDPTPLTPVKFHKMEILETISQSLGKINSEDIYFTQHQIINFCKKYLKWFDEHISIAYFLIKTEEYGDFIITAFIQGDGLMFRAGQRRYGDDDMIQTAMSGSYVVAVDRSMLTPH